MAYLEVYRIGKTVNKKSKHLFIWLLKYRMVVSICCLPDRTRRWNTVQGKVNLPCTVVKKLFLGITVRIEWICFKENGILD